ncbi:type VI secretion protein [Pseudonocardiaceae bacterium YIM PH 21723]|nr:type VI secretion protein [Pseudonocardiaceae bacterium YIM PH 21723]
MATANPNARRHASGSMPALPWVITGLIALVFVAIAAVWSAAVLAAGSGFTAPGYGEVPKALQRHGVPGLIGPNGSSTVFYAVLIVEVLLLIGAGITTTVLIVNRNPRDGLRAMTAPQGFTDLQQAAMAKRAQGLRPSLAGVNPKRLTSRQVGAELGDISGTTLYKSYEDVELMICGPRSGKTSAKVVPEILSAPGSVVATSNKPDIWILTAKMRERVGAVWLFDPQKITFQPQKFWWDPLKLVIDVESAARMASYFMREVGATTGGGADRADPFFTPAAAKTLRQLMLAAACSHHTLRDVVLWVATRSDDPAVYLERGGYAAQAASLRSTLELPPETKGGIFEGVSTALACLDSENLLRWVTPPITWEQPPDDLGEVPEFDLRTLITAVGDRHPTLFLLSREGEGSGRPVVAALVGELVQIAIDAASARGGRLDPPVTLQLDEAANIVRIPELPSFASFFGSLSLLVTVILQSREQGRAVWGKEGFDALWSACTIKTIGAGVQDSDFCEYLSVLVGDHKVEESSTSYSQGGHSISRNLRTERIMTAADIAAMGRGNALLFTSGRRPALLNLHPWFAEAGDDKEQIDAYAKEATQAIQQAAIVHLGPDNPIAVALMNEQARAQAGGSP